MEVLDIHNLLLSIVLGGLIGLNRELHNRPAGLRTHILLSLGACMFASISRQSAQLHSDPTRIAAQIVTGIGFLGAGTIIHQGIEVKGLTTAACIWVSAAIGMACGFGHEYYKVAIEGALLAVATLTGVSLIEKYVLKKNHADVYIVVDQHTTLSDINTRLRQNHMRVIGWKQLSNQTNESARYQMMLDLPTDVSDPCALLMQVEGIIEVSQA